MFTSRLSKNRKLLTKLALCLDLIDHDPILIGQPDELRELFHGILVIRWLPDRFPRALAKAPRRSPNEPPEAGMFPAIGVLSDAVRQVGERLEAVGGDHDIGADSPVRVAAR
jgi:hypothetical protein